MNLRNLIFALLAIITAISATLFFQQEDTAPTITSSPPLIDKPVAQSSSEKIPKILNASVDWEAIRKRMSIYDVGDEFTEEEIALYNSLHIEPFNPLLQKDCPTDEEVRIDLNEQAFAQLRHQADSPDAPDLTYTTPCTFVFERPIHTYATLPIEELYRLAHDDAAAALFMGLRAKKTLDVYNPETDGKRFMEDQERISWIYRAVALSEKSGPLIMLAELRYAEPGDDNDFIQRIALEMSAELMSDPRAQPQLWVDRYEEFLSGTAEMKDACPSCEFLQGESLEHALSENLTTAEEWANVYLDKAHEVQSEVTGSTQLLDLSDAGEG